MQPDDDSWAAAIYASPNAPFRLGTALVIDGRRLLTCQHVVADSGRVWVAFPKLVGAVPRGRWSAVVTQADPELDVAILQLDGAVPAGVTAPAVRCPPPQALIGKQWWAFGYESRRGNSAYGTVGASLGDGFVRIDADPGAIYRLQKGFSGAGLWSPEFDAVVGMVADADRHGNGHAVTMYEVGLRFPGEGLFLLADWTAPDAGEPALAAWGWTLDDDPEHPRHWGPRGRGVRVDSERGYRFRGRSAALSLIVDWLGRDRTDWRALVITGSPGVGKSAVLGRIVTTADADLRAAVPDDGGVYATAGSVACAVHVKGKTALETAAEIARAASAALPQTLDEFPEAMRNALAARRRRRFNIVIDALDEAAGATQARQIIRHIILPLLETSGDTGVQVIVGTRRTDDEGDLIEAFGDAARVVNLDDPEFFQQPDLVAYALATLQISSAERAEDPYAEVGSAQPLAARIAELSGQNFLVAGLTALTHGLNDAAPADPAQLTISGDVGDALLGYLRQIAPAGGIRAVTALTALAFAETPGFPLELWRQAIRALTGQQITDDALMQFVRSSAANFLVESSGTDAARVFRLFHQALNDALLYRAQDVDVYTSNKLLTQALIERGRARAWADVPAYLLRSLPVHAQRAGMIEELLGDDEFLLHADLRRLIPLTDDAVTPAGEARARLLWLTPAAVSASPAERVALFSITEALEQLGDTYRSSSRPAPFRARWAATRLRQERGVLDTSATMVCAVTSQGRALLATAGDIDGTVQIWDPYTGELQRSLPMDGGSVLALCAFTSQGRTLLAIGGTKPGDAAEAARPVVRICDPYTRDELREISIGGAQAPAVCAFTAQGRTLLAVSGTRPGESAGTAEGVIRICDPHTGEEVRVLPAGTGAPPAICSFSIQGRIILAARQGKRNAATGASEGVIRLYDPLTGEEVGELLGGLSPLGSLLCTVPGPDGALLAAGHKAVRIWDPAAGEELRTLAEQHSMGWVTALCAFSSRGRTLLAAAMAYSGISIWDPHTGDKLRTLTGQQGVPYSICAFGSQGRTLLASARHSDGKVRIWDPHSDVPAQQRAPTGSVTSLAEVRVDDQTFLASAGTDGAVRLWDPGTGQPLRVLTGHEKQVNDLCVVTASDVTRLVSAGDDRKLRVWDTQAGKLDRSVSNGVFGFFGSTAICAFSSGGQDLLAVAGKRSFVRILDARSWAPVRTIKGLPRTVRGICAYDAAGAARIVLACADGKVRVVDPEDARVIRTLVGHLSRVNSVCTVTLDAATLIASAGEDQTIRIWDPEAGTQVRVLKGHAGAVRSAAPFVVGGQARLVSTSTDRVVRVWHLDTPELPAGIPIVHQGAVVRQIGNALAVGSPAGLILIEPAPADDSE